jgi:hypothetical protein
VVSMLASSTQDRGFAPDRSRRIFSVEKILGTPSFGGEVKHLSHVPALGHVKEPSSFVNYESASKITYSSLPAWYAAPLEMNEGTHSGARIQ